MKTGFFMKGLFAIVFILLLFPFKTFGEISPFKVSTTLLNDHVSASDLIPVTVSISIAPNHHIYKDQIKVESGVSGQFTIASIALPAGKIKFDPFLEKEVELYEEEIAVKLFLQASKDIPSGQYHIKLKVSYQGCSDKICFAPKTEEFTLPVQVEPASWGVGVSQGEEKPIRPVSKPDKKPETTGFQKTIESKGILYHSSSSF